MISARPGARETRDSYRQCGGGGALQSAHDERLHPRQRPSTNSCGPASCIARLSAPALPEVELAAELHKTMRDLAAYGLDQIDFDKSIKLTIIEGRTAHPRGRCRSSLAASIQDMLSRLGIQVSRRPAGHRNHKRRGCVLASGEFLAAEMVVWAAGIKAPDFLKGLDGLENRTGSIGRWCATRSKPTRDDNIFGHRR